MRPAIPRNARSAQHDRHGQSEAIKSLIRDAEFFRWLDEHASALATGAREPLAQLIGRRNDPPRPSRPPVIRSDRRARPLDFGHWAAHKLESMTAGALRHGKRSPSASRSTLSTRSSRDSATGGGQAVLSLLGRLGLPLWHDALRAPGLLAGLDEFRQHLGGSSPSRCYAASAMASRSSARSRHARSHRPSRRAHAMKLGMARVAAARARVNLPTVWSNVLAGVICRARRFARDARRSVRDPLALLRASMLLNDAFDQTRTRASDQRPISRPRPHRHRVHRRRRAARRGHRTARPALGRLRKVGVALAVTIVIYDAWHKRQNPVAPLLMGACRAGLSRRRLRRLGPRGQLRAAGRLRCGHRVRRVSHSRVKLRRASARVVAVLIAGYRWSTGFAALAIEPQLAACAALGFPLTLLGQRWVRGT